MQHPVYSYTQTGSYQVTFTTTNDLGCNTSLTQTVFNHSNPVAEFSNELACGNTETFFFDESEVEDANITSWEWDFGDPDSVNANASTEKNPTHIFTATGMYEVRLTATSNFGCTDSVTHFVDVLESPQALFGLDKSCLGEPTQFTDMSSDSEANPILSHIWVIDGQVFAEQNPVYTFPASGEYVVSLTVTATNFCLSTFQDTVSVNPPPVASFDFTQACEDGPVTFFDTSQTFNDPVAEWEWIIGDQTFLQDSAVTIVPDTSGDYLVTLIVTTFNNCVNSVSETITINSLPDADFETNTSFGAYPLEVQFTNTSTEASQYRWSFDKDTLQSTDLHPVYTFDEPGEYNVILVTFNDAGCSDTICQEIKVVEPVMDVQLNQIITKPDNAGRVQLILDMQNNGSITMDETNLEFRISIGTDVELTEPFKDVLYALQKTNYTLNFELSEEVQNKVPFICIELLTSADNNPESDPSNNSVCINLAAEPVFITPFPNPADDRVSVGIIIPEKDDIHITWINSKGDTFFRQTVTETTPGYNVVSVDVQIYRAGTYFMRVVYRNYEKTFKVVIR